MLDEMRALVLLAEEGSIQKVARRLPLTQPAVTRQIQRLEQNLGVELLDRRQKPPQFTPAGHEVLRRCREILGAYAELRAVAGRSEPEGTLRFGVANGLADDGFAAIVAATAARFSRVLVRLGAGWSLPMTEQVRRGQLDAAFVLSAETPLEGAVPVGRESLAVIASQDRVTGARGLGADQGWILSPEPCGARQALIAVLGRRGQHLQIAAEVQDAGLQLALVREGLGLGLMPRRLLAQRSGLGIGEVGASELELGLDVWLLRSPYLGTLAPVVDFMAERLEAALVVPQESDQRRSG